MNDIIELLTVAYTQGAGGNQQERITKRREVFCHCKSIGMREAYKAAAVDRNPEISAVLADRLDYEGERYVLYNGQVYVVSRTFSTGIRLELTLERTRDLEGLILCQCPKAL